MYYIIHRSLPNPLPSFPISIINIFLFIFILNYSTKNLKMAFLIMNLCLLKELYILYLK